MKKDAKTMTEVAQRCSKYHADSDCHCGNAKNSTADSISCSNCTHYTPVKVCSLDLYEEIVNDHDL